MKLILVATILDSFVRARVRTYTCVCLCNVHLKSSVPFPPYTFLYPLLLNQLFNVVASVSLMASFSGLNAVGMLLLTEHELV